MAAADEVDAGLAFTARYDSRDTASFATERHVGGGRVSTSRTRASAPTAIGNASRPECARRSRCAGTSCGSASRAVPASATTFPAIAASRWAARERLPAYQFDEIRVESYWLAQGSFLWRIKDLSTIKNQALYAGFGVYAAGLYDRFDGAADDEIYGASAYLAGSTPIGSINLGVGYAENNSAIWISIGKPVGRGSILDDGLFR